ncbi:MAG: hypothetical protein CMH32_00590 [Micavibrio sp.]|nr:hypothetical protein [Micavibrio sp.]HCK32013.1 hypothetical protein [Rhodospirillaceae bacterium]
MEMTTSSFLDTLPLLGSSSDDFQKKAYAQARTIKASKGDIIALHEDIAKNFFVITKGWIKLYRETLDGAQAVIDIMDAGHMFGESALFHDGTYPFNAEAVEEVELIAIPLELLKKEIDSNPDMTRTLLSFFARQRHNQDREIEHRTVQNAPQRIGCFLLRLANQTAPDNTITIHLPYDKTLVASRLGMQPETFSRALTKLKEKTGIRVKGATIEMESLSQLSDFSCAACSSSFPCKDL